MQPQYVITSNFSRYNAHASLNKQTNAHTDARLMRGGGHEQCPHPLLLSRVFNV